jgi:hypothetical protein
MAAAYDCQDKMDDPNDGDLIALYANNLGIIAFGYAAPQTAYINDERVGNTPTKIRRLENFRYLAIPIHHTEFGCSVGQTLQQVKKDRDTLFELLMDRALPERDPDLFAFSESVS